MIPEQFKLRAEQEFRLIQLRHSAEKLDKAELIEQLLQIARTNMLQQNYFAAAIKEGWESKPQ